MDSQQGTELTREQLVQHVKGKFGLDISKSYLTNLRKRKAEVRCRYKNANVHEKRKKSSHRSNVEELNEALAGWLTKMEEKKVPITDAVLKEKARQLGQGLTLPPNFAYSNTWLLNFKRSFGVSSQTMHGEADAADQAGIDRAREYIPRLLAGVELKDIYNLDETALLFRKLPTRSLMLSKRAGGKRAKDRITLNFIVSADGNDVSVQAIGTSRRPRCFGRGFEAKRCLNICYFANAKGWMNSEIFEQIMRSFNMRMLNENRKVWLLLDNCSAHRIPRFAKPARWLNVLDGFSMTAVNVVFLPPNTTSIVQPLDQGIIRAFKAHWRRYHVQWIVEKMEQERSEQSADMLKTNVRQALVWTRDACREIHGSTIRNCFRKSGILTAIHDAEIKQLDDNGRKSAISDASLRDALEDITKSLSKLEIGHIAVEE
eukprot:scaffold4382_cov372-Pinguiococcus_pyrenoidosus.AAC.1